MKFRIIAAIVVVALGLALWFVAEGMKGTGGTVEGGGRPDSNDIRNLKIN